MWNNQKQSKSCLIYVKLQTNYHLKLDFQKVDQHTGGKGLIHGTQTSQGQSVAKPGTPL